MDRQHQVIELPEPVGRMTAAEKIERTLREVSKPDADAGELELGLATIAFGLEAQLAGKLGEYQESGELDEFVLAMTRWFASHRSDRAGLLLVVEVPNRGIPAGKCVQLMEAAAKAAHEASLPWS